MTLIKILNERAQKRESLRKKALDEVDGLITTLRKRFHFDSVYIFGSILTNRFGADSDIDLIIKGLNPKEFFKAHAFLIKHCMYEIDLKPFEELNDAFKKRVLKGGIRIG